MCRPAVASGSGVLSTLGQFLRASTHGHTSQLASVPRAHLVNLAERTDLLPGIEQETYVDIDSLLRPVYGHAKQGASFGRTKIAGRVEQLGRPAARAAKPQRRQQAGPRMESHLREWPRGQFRVSQSRGAACGQRFRHAAADTGHSELQRDGKRSEDEVVWTPRVQQGVAAERGLLRRLSRLERGGCSECMMGSCNPRQGPRPRGARERVVHAGGPASAAR